MQIVEYVYQNDFLQIGYFVALVATIMKFYSERFKGKPAYFLVLVNDILKLSFISLTVLVGFSVVVLVNRNYDAIQTLIPPPAPEPIIIYEDRVSQMNEKLKQIDYYTNPDEGNRAATALFNELFGSVHRDRQLTGVIFRPYGWSGLEVACGETQFGSRFECVFVERG